MEEAPAHRGAVGDMASFAPKFIQGRLIGFEKDIRICLTPIKLSGRANVTHAYFPALSACCGTLEYLTGLFQGKLNRIGWQQIALFAERYLPQPDFNGEAVRVLFEVLRHSVAHRGIASGVWIDRNQGPGAGRRITWKISADAKRPACDIVAQAGILRKDPPWPCHYTHRVHIHLLALSIDIRKSASAYSEDLAHDVQLQKNFENCMRRLYPD